LALVFDAPPVAVAPPVDGAPPVLAELVLLLDFPPVALLLPPVEV
jgi:hypothetical protein